MRIGDALLGVVDGSLLPGCDFGEQDQHLRRHGVQSARWHRGRSIRNLLAQPEIDHGDPHLPVQKDVSRFQVLVDQFSLVQRLESNNYLDEDVAQKVNQVLRVLVNA